jgi:transposase
MNIWMDRIEQRVMVKYFFLKGHGNKLIHKELVSTLQDNAISLSTVKNWLRRFKSGDLCCGDEERPRRRLISLAGSSALSERASLRECSNDRRAFLGGLGYDQELS